MIRVVPWVVDKTPEVVVGRIALQVVAAVYINVHTLEVISSRIMTFSTRLSDIRDDHVHGIHMP